MILTVTLNPSIDKTFIIPNFKTNRLNRSKFPTIKVGGKGINAAIVIKLLGEEAITTGFIGNLSGQNVAEALREKHITTNFAHIERSTRTNYIVLDPPRQTQINEEGPQISKDELDYFLEIYERSLAHVKLVLIAGSVPPGLGHDIYSELIRKAKKSKIKSFLSATGKPLEIALDNAPNIVRLNFRTEQPILGLKPTNLKTKLRIANKILGKGTETVLFADQELSEIIITKEKTFRVRPTEKSIKSMMGAEDSLLGALSVGIARNQSLMESARLALCASVCTAQRLSAVPEKIDDIEKLKPFVLIEELEL